MKRIAFSFAILALQAVATLAQEPNRSLCKPDWNTSDINRRLCDVILTEDAIIRQNIGKQPPLSLLGNCAIDFSHKFPGIGVADYILACQGILNSHPNLGQTISATAAKIPLNSRWFFEGDWGVDKAECKDDEGPNFRTLIDLRNTIKGKAAPILDRYEHHCVIDQMEASGSSVTLVAVCYEFLDDLDAKEEGERETFRISSRLNGEGVIINGKSFLKCKDADR